jgi:hypothetical protein
VKSFSSLAAGLGVYPAAFALPHARKHRQAFGLRRGAIWGISTTILLGGENQQATPAWFYPLNPLNPCTKIK